MTPLPPQPPGDPPNPGSDPPAAGASTWTRIDALFHEAGGLDAPGRAALLARAAREEPALAAELASLLEAHDRALELAARVC